jgi:NAD(P)-dependent dehydrogenase (short-subunit alcohol dehydrogenase family)
MPDTKKVVLVTGASSGFGRLTAELLARRGYRVYATMRDAGGRNAAPARELRDLASVESLDLHVAEMDVTEDASVEACVRRIVDGARRIDVLVNNAGFGYAGLLESFTVEQASRIFETNVFGALRAARAVLPQMHRQHDGLLVQVSSGAGRVVIPSMGLYCASKFALEALSETWRYELASAGIDSVCVEPGAYPTAIFGKIGTGADPAREAPYGAARGIAPKVMAALTASKADPRDFAEAMLRIIETPKGLRAVRYRVGHGAKGVEAINAVSAQAQEEFLTALGLAEVARLAG